LEFIIGVLGCKKKSISCSFRIPLSNSSNAATNCSVDDISFRALAFKEKKPAKLEWLYPNVCALTIIIRDSFKKVMFQKGSGNFVLVKDYLTW